MKKIVITGIGCISSLGKNADEFIANVIAGNSGIAPITLFDNTHFKAKVAAEVKNYDQTKFFTSEQLSLLDRYAQFALLSTSEAINDAQLHINESNSHRVAVIHGSGVSGQTTQDENYYKLYGENAKRLHPYTVPKLMCGSAASHISMEFGITGPTFTTASACSSAAHAIATACMFLRSGLIDTVITGGAEAPVTPGSIKAWESLRVMSYDTCRPFSASRNGMVIGEGAGTLILETLEHAQSRGAKIYAELAGFGMSSDAHNIIQPSEAGPTRAIQAALDDAGIKPHEVQYINAHGTGTPQNDPVETRAIRNVLNGSANRIAVSSTKSTHGHALGAAAALESIATIGAIQKQTAPPTMNYVETDPECDLDYVPNEARPMEIDTALCNSFAFGGLNVSLVYKRYEG